MYGRQTLYLCDTEGPWTSTTCSIARGVSVGRVGMFNITGLSAIAMALCTYDNRVRGNSSVQEVT